MRARAISLLCAPLVVVTACAHGRGVDNPRPGSAGVSVVVDNQFVEDARVYLVRGETPILLGRVGSFESRTFRLGPGLLPANAEVRLRVRPLNGRLYDAPAVLANPGDHVIWRLGPRLELSSVIVR